MSRNQLDQSNSPYLLLHKDNPVHWYPWGREALEAAESSGKPIYLCIGYSACHWCHLADAESFSDPDTAALRVGGRFRTDDVQDFFRGLESALPVSIRRAPDGVIYIDPRH